jgi:hypothetical protein
MVSAINRDGLTLLDSGSLIDWYQGQPSDDHIETLRRLRAQAEREKDLQMILFYSGALWEAERGLDNQGKSKEIKWQA